jgi:murein DD-endopeptidase MepM/ murein hydrolase activator NlpD
VDVPGCPPPSASPHLWFAYPISPADNDSPTTYYPYGSTAGGQYLVHHGVDLVNPEGTSVLAAGSGIVVYAGDDAQRIFSYRPDFYGQLVLLQMDRTYGDQPVFTLYGHLSATCVREGQRVDGGQKLGEVGATGIAMGPHLHFEVRINDAEDYSAARNPELWLRPHSGRGIIAGQVLDETGRALSEVRLMLYPADALEYAYRDGWTYAPEVGPDEEWSETFVLGDVPAGEWAVVAFLPDRRLRQRVTVHPGEIAWVCLRAPTMARPSPPHARQEMAIRPAEGEPT